MLEMVAHQASAYSARRFLNRGNLHHYIGAVAIGLDHVSEPTDLALDATEPLQISRLDTRVYGDGFARCSPGDFTGASRALLFRDSPNAHQSNIPLGGILRNKRASVKKGPGGRKAIWRGFLLYGDNYER